MIQRSRHGEDPGRAVGTDTKAAQIEDGSPHHALDVRVVGVGQRVDLVDEQIRLELRNVLLRQRPLLGVAVARRGVVVHAETVLTRLFAPEDGPGLLHGHSPALQDRVADDEHAAVALALGLAQARGILRRPPQGGALHALDDELRAGTDHHAPWRRVPDAHADLDQHGGQG